MCREDGTVVDDLLVYALAEDRLLLVVNAANIEEDFRHVSSFEHSAVELENVSDNFALLAIQGPRAKSVLVGCPFFSGSTDQIDQLSYYRGLTFDYRGDEVLVSRTGYTGERGYEVFVPVHLAETLWIDIAVAGKTEGLMPIGLGGLHALRKEKEAGPKRRLVGLELEGRNIARQGYPVVGNSGEIGRVTSGTFSPTLQKSLCMAIIKTSTTGEGEYGLKIRGRTIPARLTPLPFYQSRAK
jgi:aminomethyltransferase